MKFWKKCKEQPWFSYSVAICIGILFYTLITHISVITDFISGVWTIIKPLLYGLIIAYLIDPIARFYQNKPFKKIKNKKIARNISVILADITVIVVIALLSVAIFPQLIKSIVNMVELVTKEIKSLESGSGSFLDSLPFGLGKSFENFSISDSVLDSVSSFLTDNMSDIADTSMSVGNGFANVLIAFILSIYYMLDKDRLKMHTNKFFLLILKEQRYLPFKAFCKRADVILLRYITCSLIEGLFVGVLNAILMLIFGMPYVLLISVVVGVTNLAPTFGPVVGAVIGALLLVIINPVYALIFLIFTVVIQTLDGYVLKPKLFGETLGVSPLLILVTIIIGGRLFGVIGILLAIPFAAILSYVVDEISKHKKSDKPAAAAEQKSDEKSEAEPADPVKSEEQ